MLAVAFVLILLLLLVLAAAVVIGVRFGLNVVRLNLGLRADVDRLAGEFARVATEREQLDKAVQGAIGAAHQRITSTHGVAAIALDRILYYTRRDKGLAKLGQLYDRAIAKIKAKAEAEAKASEEKNAEMLAAALKREAAGEAPQPEVAQPLLQSIDDVDQMSGDESEPDEQGEQDVAPEAMGQVIGSIGAPCG